MLSHKQRAILEALQDREVWSLARIIANVPAARAAFPDHTKRQLGQTLSLMVRKCLLKRCGRGEYQITHRGLQCIKAE